MDLFEELRKKMNDPKVIEQMAKQMKDDRDNKLKRIQSVNKDKFEKFIKILKESDGKTLSDDDLAYKPLPNFTRDDFSDIWDFLNHTYLKGDIGYNGHDCSGEHFPDLRAYFQYNKTRFIMRLLIGQGSALQFIASWSEDWPDVPMKFRESKKIIIKF